MALSCVSALLRGCSGGRVALSAGASALLVSLFLPRPWGPSTRAVSTMGTERENENETLVSSLATLGVDVAMVRRRQPGVLRKACTNEHGLADFLQAKGASQEAVASIISRYPRAITRSHQHLEERWQLWRSIFQADGEIVKILERSPESFFRSSDNDNLEKNITFLGSLGLAARDLHRLLSTAPRTFSNSVELNRQMVEMLQDVCVSLGGEQPELFVKNIISRNLYVLICSTKRIRTNVQFLQRALGLSNAELLGFLQGQGADILDLSCDYMCRNFSSTQQQLQGLGCSAEEVKRFVMSYPPMLFSSSKNLRSKIDCLLAGGVDIRQVLEKPRVLDFSVENVQGRLRELERAGYDVKKNGIAILDCSRKRFEAKLEKLAAPPEE